jgi:hypothetical protein
MKKSRVTDDLSTILATTHEFLNLSHPEQSQKCKLAIESVKHEFISLSVQYNVSLLKQH